MSRPTASSVLLVDGVVGREWSADVPQRPMGLVRLLAVAAALEAGKPRWRLVPGRRRWTEDLTLALRSTSALEELATAVVGQDEAFVILMNRAASDAGLSATRIASLRGNRSGDVTTARDTALLVAGLCVKHPRAVEILRRATDERRLRDLGIELGRLRQEGGEEVQAQTVFVAGNKRRGYHAVATAVVTGDTAARPHLLVAATLGQLDAVSCIETLARQFGTATGGASWGTAGEEQGALAVRYSAGPEIGTRSAFVIDATRSRAVQSDEADTAIYRKDPDLPQYPASVVKLMTAIIAADHFEDLERPLTVEHGDLRSGSGNNLEPGDIVTVRELLHDLLIPSSNTAATLLARVIEGELTGDEPAGAGFVGEMNRRGEAIGMTRTRFANPSGLYTARMRSTVRDIARLALMAFDHPVLVEIMGKATYEVEIRGPRSRVEPVVSTVEALALDGVLAGKTGTRTRNPMQRNLVVLYEDPAGHRSIITLVGSSTKEGRDQDLVTLLTFIDSLKDHGRSTRLRS